jgi:polyisoprenoid-binding protein YceI
MKFLKITIVALLLSNVLIAQKFVATDAGSKVSFVIKNFGIKTVGSFSGLKGNITFDPNALNASTFNMSVQANSIDTDNNTRDKHLRKEDYFHVEKYPLLSFVSTKVTRSSTPGRFYIVGNLSMKGITKTIEFGFSANATATGYFFKGEFEINRRNFGIGGSSVSLSDKLIVKLDIAANK